jgi:ABC-2 type transport system permease protein
LVIAVTGIRAALSKKLFLWVMLFAWAQFFVRAVIFYLSATIPTLDILAPSVETFRQFFEVQELFVLVVTVYVGSGLIANDRRSNALQIYLSKPLTRAEYVAGKLGILLFFLLLVTLVPALALLFVQMMFSASLTFVRENLFLIPAITLYALVEVLLASFTMLALSSLSSSARYTSILYFGSLFFTGTLFTILRGITGSSALAWLSFRANLEQIGDVIFRLQPRFDSPWLLSVGVVLALIGVSALVLERRVRGVEVVT